MPKPQQSRAPASSQPKPPTEVAESEVVRTRYQKFKKAVIRRSEIRDFPRNPRVINPYARGRLKENLRARGEMGGIVVNVEPGPCFMCIVSGHQRVKILDALEERDDYGIEVNLVHLTPQEHAEQLALMNNYYAQGDWDAQELAAFLAEYHPDLGQAGFEPFDLQAIFDRAGVVYDVTPILEAARRPEAVAELEAELAQIKTPPAVEREAKEAAAAAAMASPEGIAEMKAAKREHQESVAERDNGELYLVLVCPSSKDAAIVGAWFGLDPAERHLSYERFRERLQMAGVKELP